ncbi:MAG: hypothetical protein U0841_32075 [Chloroflexia bacterium]
MVAARVGDGREQGLRRGARGRYAPPPQLFPLALVDLTERPDSPYLVEREADGTYLVRQRETSRLIARTGDPATLRGCCCHW